MGQGLVLGDGTSTIAAPGLENTDAIAGTQTTQLVISMDDTSANPNVVAGDFDLFFYSVNDASHTWIETKDQPLALENYHYMQINAY